MNITFLLFQAEAEVDETFLSGNSTGPLPRIIENTDMKGHAFCCLNMDTVLQPSISIGSSQTQMFDSHLGLLSNIWELLESSLGDF